MNPISINNAAKASFFSRFYQYQKERFPILGHGLLVAAFTFSAISYSRICRGMTDFVNWKIYGIGILTTVSLFLLVRIFDEFKDQEEDAQFRPDLPVQRGLISLQELFAVGLAVFLGQILLNLFFFPKMLTLYALVIIWLCLMGKEFFIPEWLKANPFWYVSSHMLIIPLVDVYASGLDWLLEGATAPKGLLFFFAVSFMNGIVLEVGRKIRSPEKEKEGVNSYTQMLGMKRAIALWMGLICFTCCLSVAAATYAGYGLVAIGILGLVLLVCLVPAILFWRKPTEKFAQLIEKSSALWTIIMYLALGGIPMLRSMLN